MDALDILEEEVKKIPKRSRKRKRKIPFVEPEKRMKKIKQRKLNQNIEVEGVNITSSSRYKTKRLVNVEDRWRWEKYYPDPENAQLSLFHWGFVNDDQPFPPFAIFNEKVDMFTYSDEEYQFLEQYLGKEWSKAQTDELFAKCEMYDMRFAVIQDRLSFVKDLESIKHRYFTVAQTLLFLRSGGDIEKCIKHPIMNKSYDKTKELRRKTALNSYYNRDIKLDNKERDSHVNLREVTSSRRRLDTSIRRLRQKIRTNEIEEKRALREFVISRRPKPKPPVVIPIIPTLTSLVQGPSQVQTQPAVVKIEPKPEEPPKKIQIDTSSPLLDVDLSQYGNYSKYSIPESAIYSVKSSNLNLPGSTLYKPLPPPPKEEEEPEEKEEEKKEIEVKVVKKRGRPRKSDLKRKRGRGRPRKTDFSDHIIKIKKSKKDKYRKKKKKKKRRRKIVRIESDEEDSSEEELGGKNVKKQRRKTPPKKKVKVIEEQLPIKLICPSFPGTVPPSDFDKAKFKNVGKSKTTLRSSMLNYTSEMRKWFRQNKMKTQSFSLVNSKLHEEFSNLKDKIHKKMDTD